MLKNYEFWTLTGVGAIAVILTGINMYLAQANGTLQNEASSRAQYIQQSVALGNLYRDVAQALAERAVRTRDDQVRDLLAAEGFTVNFNGPAAAPAPDTKRDH